MATLIKKKIGKRFYYYIVESKRVSGQPRIVSQVYLGSVENILKKFQEGGAEKKEAGITPKINIQRRESEMSEEKKKPEEEEAEIDFGVGKLGFGGLFKGIGNFIDLVSKMTEEGKEEASRTGEFKIKGMPGEAKGVYGFTVKMGLGGAPTVEQFGNIRETAKGPVVEEVREPIVDVFDEEDKVLVITELPGVEEGDISTEVKGDILTIEASNEDRKYAKEVLLPCQVEIDKMQSSYKNGVLEIVFPKPKQKKQ